MHTYTHNTQSCKTYAQAEITYTDDYSAAVLLGKWTKTTDPGAKIEGMQVYTQITPCGITSPHFYNEGPHSVRQ